MCAKIACTCLGRARACGQFNGNGVDGSRMSEAMDAESVGDQDTAEVEDEQTLELLETTQTQDFCLESIPPCISY